MDVEAGSLCEPESYLGMLVGGVVVDDQMDVEMLGHGLLDALEEGKKLLVTMAWLALGEHCSGCDVERGEQRRGAMADVVVGHPFYVTQAHRQHGLGAIEGLDLRLFILIGNRTGPSRPEFIVKTTQTPLDKALTPLADRRLGPVQLRRDLSVALAFRRR